MDTVSKGMNEHVCVCVRGTFLPPFDAGVSSTMRQRREELSQALRKLIQNRAKTSSLKYQWLFDELRAQSDLVCCG